MPHTVHPHTSDAARDLREKLWVRKAPKLLGPYLSDTAIMLGALSIVTFWAFGVGVALGVGAVVAGIVAARQPDVQDNESASLKALLGMLAGVFGIVAGVIFLASALPNL